MGKMESNEGWDSMDRLGCLAGIGSVVCVGVMAAVLISQAEKEDPQYIDSLRAKVAECVAKVASNQGISSYNLLRAQGFPSQCSVAEMSGSLPPAPDSTRKYVERETLKVVADWESGVVIKDPEALTCFADELEKYLLATLPEAKIKQINPKMDLQRIGGGGLGGKKAFNSDLCLPKGMQPDLKKSVSTTKATEALQELSRRGWDCRMLKAELRSYVRNNNGDDDIAFAVILFLSPLNPMSPLDW